MKNEICTHHQQQAYILQKGAVKYIPSDLYSKDTRKSTRFMFAYQAYKPYKISLVYGYTKQHGEKQVAHQLY